MPYQFSDPRCAQWYKAYPRHIAPKDVERAWMRMTDNDVAQALAVVEAYAKSWKIRGDIQYCPYPASYLNAGRFWDEPDVVPQQNHPDFR